MEKMRRLDLDSEVDVDKDVTICKSLHCILSLQNVFSDLVISFMFRKLIISTDQGSSTLLLNKVFLAYYIYISLLPIRFDSIKL